MVRQNERTKRSREVSNPGFWSLCKGRRVVGWRSYRLYYGASTPRLTDPRGLRRFLWFMGQRRFSQVIYDMTHLAWRHMLKRIMSRHGRTLLTCWMRSVTWQLPVQRFTSKIFAVTTAVGLGPEPFRRGIWCFGSSRISLININYPRLGKDLLWSERI